MAAPRTGHIVHTLDGLRVLVLSDRDAKTYPNRVGSAPVVILRGDGGTVDLPTFYVLDPVRHPFPESPPLVFDKVAADARKALRDAALSKLTQAEREALVGTGADS